MYVDIYCEDEDINFHGFVCQCVDDINNRNNNCNYSYHFKCQGYHKTDDGKLYSGWPLEEMENEPTQCSYCRYHQKKDQILSDIDIEEVPIYNKRDGIESNEQECLNYFRSLTRQQQAIRMGMASDSTRSAVNAVFKFLKEQPSKVLMY